MDKPAAAAAAATLTRSSFMAFSLAEPFGYFFLHTILSWAIIMLPKFFFRFLQTHTIMCRSSINIHHACDKYNFSTKEDEEDSSVRSPGGDRDGYCSSSLRREDVEMAMERMGMIMCCDDRDQLKEEEDVVFEDMFAEEEPSLEELKEAFCVFDESGDGFIDAPELQRALSKLGFAEEGPIALDACREMISNYDGNCTGQIDFNQFIKLMEKSFC